MGRGRRKTKHKVTRNTKKLYGDFQIVYNGSMSEETAIIVMLLLVSLSLYFGIRQKKFALYEIMGPFECPSLRERPRDYWIILILHVLVIVVSVVGGVKTICHSGKHAKESVLFISAENQQQVFSQSVPEPSKRLYTELCALRLPFFHVNGASASDIFKFIEDAYNDYTDPFLNRAASPKPKQSIFDLSGIDSEVLSSKITRNIEDITLMRMLHEVCGEIDVDMGLRNGKIVFAKRPKGVSVSEMCQPRFWPEKILPEAIITRGLVAGPSQ